MKTEYTVKELAELSNVSVRALHFYDEIGLLKPARTADNGYRYYQRPQLLRLQKILFYKELSFSLEEIEALLLLPDENTIHLLKSQREKIGREIEDKKLLLETLEKTIHSIERGEPMKDNELYKGFDAKKQEDFENYLTSKFGKYAEEKIAESKERMKNWSQQDRDRAQNEQDEVARKLALLMQQGKKPHDQAVQSEVARHFELVKKYWTPNAKAYRGLAQMYLDHPDFKRYYESFATGLTEFLAAAMNIYAHSVE